MKWFISILSERLRLTLKVIIYKTAQNCHCQNSSYASVAVEAEAMLRSYRKSFGNGIILTTCY